MTSLDPETDRKRGTDRGDSAIRQAERTVGTLPSDRRESENPQEKPAPQAPRVGSGTDLGRITAETILASLSTHLCVVDPNGNILAVNPAWERFSTQNGGDPRRTGVGANYFDVCREILGGDAETARAAYEGLKALIGEQLQEFSLEYPCHGPNQERWFQMHATRLLGASGEVVVGHTNVSARRRAERALRESEDRLRMALDAAEVGTWRIDLRTKRETRDANLNRLIGMEPVPTEVSDDDYPSRIHPDDRQRCQAVWERAVATLGSFDLENRVVLRDGSIRWVRDRGRVYSGSDGRPAYATGAVVDITERKLAEIALRDSERFLREVLDSLYTFVGVLKPDGTLIQANRAALAVAGLRPEDVLGKPFERTYWWSHSPQVQGRIREAIERGARGEPSRFDVQIVVSAQRRLLIDFQLVPMFDDRGQVTHLIPSASDITERVALQKELLTIAEREQRRIGQDLHDDIGQELTGIGLMVETLAEALKESGSPEATLASRIAESLENVRHGVRRLIQGLVPVEVDAQGLMAALDELARRVRDQYGIVCTFDGREIVSINDNQVATQLYRITQEAVANAIRHGGARAIAITLGHRDGALVLEIRDHGRGLPPEARRGRGMGLRIMHYRAAEIGGILEMRSMPGGGTSVVCTLRGERGHVRDDTIGHLEPGGPDPNRRRSPGRS